MKKYRILAVLSVLSFALAVGSLLFFYFKEVTQTQAFINITNIMAGIILSIHFGNEAQILNQKENGI